MRSLHVLAPLLVALSLGLVPSAARAALDLRRLDTSLVDLPFGGDLDDVARWVQQRLERHYAPRIKAALDDNERAKLRAQLGREVFEFRSRVVTFDGHRTGFEVSPIAGEFTVGANETMARFRDRQGDHYFFFINSRLWKYALADRPDTPFADRVAEYARRLGEPKHVDSSRDASGHEAAPVRALWRDDRLEVRLWNRRLLYAYDVLIIAYRPIADRIGALRGGEVLSDPQGAIDPSIESFLLDDGEDEEDELRRADTPKPPR